MIRSFLSVSLQEHLNIPCTITNIQLPQIVPAVSQQRNYVDCGCFLLGFAQAIFHNITQVPLEGNAKTIQKNANQLFSWLVLPRNSIRTLRSLIAKTIQKLTQTTGKDEFSVESSNSSDVEEIQQVEGESIAMSKLMNGTNSTPNTTNVIDSTLNESTSSPSKIGIPEEVQKIQCTKEEKAENKGLSLFDLHPSPIPCRDKYSPKISKMKVEKVKKIPGIDTQFPKKR